MPYELVRFDPAHALALSPPRRMPSPLVEAFGRLAQSAGRAAESARSLGGLLCEMAEDDPGLGGDCQGED